ncbi:MAG TPA: hypothetical protein VEQ40_11735 [Pyrinomonadaceae bacterium]|nr:hypothetical protein [Pyrinomonadaceae bacterium]
MKTLRLVLISLLFCSFLLTDARAQQDKREVMTRAKIAVEVTYWKGVPPAYNDVPGRSWFGRFRRIAGWKAEPGALPVRAVDIATRVEGDAVRVIVSVHVGEKFHERLDPVGSYLIRENERLVVDKLKAFGVEPFELAVVRVAPQNASLPTVRNNTSSVSVVNMQIQDDTIPVLVLTVLNSSSKNIVALSIDSLMDGRPGTSGWAQKDENQVVIAAGANYEYKQSFNYKAQPIGNGYTLETPPAQTVVIKAALFEDGTYEGDVREASELKSSNLGRRTQLEQILALYEQAMESTESDAKVILESLRAKVAALGTDADQSALNNLLSSFPALPGKERFKVGVEVSMFYMKKERLQEIDLFRTQHGSTPSREATQAWLSANKERFQKWLDRLKPLT